MAKLVDEPRAGRRPGQDGAQREVENGERTDPGTQGRLKQSGHAHRPSDDTNDVEGCGEDPRLVDRKSWRRRLLPLLTAMATPLLARRQLIGCFEALGLVT